MKKCYDRKVKKRLQKTPEKVFQESLKKSLSIYMLNTVSNKRRAPRREPKIEKQLVDTN
jgi:hypothetical protein